jgi:hypothetical protein
MKVWTVALTALFAAAMLGGCGFFQKKGDEWEPAKTSSGMSDSNASATPVEPVRTQPPAETYVEPLRPWGSETRDNLLVPSE